MSYLMAQEAKEKSEEAEGRWKYELWLHQREIYDANFGRDADEAAELETETFIPKNEAEVQELLQMIREMEQGVRKAD